MPRTEFCVIAKLQQFYVCRSAQTITGTPLYGLNWTGGGQCNNRSKVNSVPHNTVCVLVHGKLMCFNADLKVAELNVGPQGQGRLCLQQS